MTCKNFLTLMADASVWKPHYRVLYSRPLVPPYVQPRDYELILITSARQSAPDTTYCPFCKNRLALSHWEHSFFLGWCVRVCHVCLAECVPPGSRTHGYIVPLDRVRTLYGLTDDERNEAHSVSINFGGPSYFWAGELEYLAKRKHGREGARKWAKRREPPEREQPERATKRAKKDT
jgi:hypothetical protein